MAEVTCPGYCCAAFYLPVTPAELRRRAATIEDGAQIAAMVIPLTKAEARKRLRAAGSPEPDGAGRHAGPRHMYTCRHWDAETKLCGIYPDRPGMCRRYPATKDGPRSCDHGCDYCPINNREESA